MSNRHLLLLKGPPPRIFGQIFGQVFGQVFDQVFGQVFDQVFGQVFGKFWKNTVLPLEDSNPNSRDY